MTKKRALLRGKAFRGFTIVEIVIVIVISSVFMTFGVSRYREFARRQEVVVVKRSIISDLRQAQKDSISGRKPVDFNGQSCLGTLSDYSVDFGIDSYEITVNCTDPVSIVLKTIELPSNVQITVPASNPIQFKPFTLATNIPNSGLGYEIISITSTAVPGVTETVTINWTGEIE